MKPFYFLVIMILLSFSVSADECGNKVCEKLDNASCEDCINLGDLIVQSISLLKPSQPLDGDTVELKIVIKNIGAGYAFSDFKVVGDGTESVEGDVLSPGATDEFIFEKKLNSVKNYTLEVIVNPLSKSKETNYDNNNRSISIEVGSAECGDNVCSGSESPGDCCIDCGCYANQKCKDNSCVDLEWGDCKKHSDCDDGNACTKNWCRGKPSKCDFSEIIIECSNNDGCCPEGCVYASDDDCQKPAECGDNKCEQGETKETCCNDCGCEEGSYCRNNVCISKCGDGVCDGTESKEICCIDCGCDPGFYCKNSVCVDKCGDKFCGEGESKENCCSDCSCEYGFSCNNNVCIKTDICKDNSGCDDNNPCTDDICDGSPKECKNVPSKNCVNDDKCCSEACSFRDDNDCQVNIVCGDGICDKGENKENCCDDCGCELNYECRDKSCQETEEKAVDDTIKTNPEIDQEYNTWTEKGFSLEQKTYSKGRFVLTFEKGSKTVEVIGTTDENQKLKNYVINKNYIEHLWTFVGATIGVLFLLIAVFIYERKKVHPLKPSIQQYIVQLRQTGYTDGQIRDNMKKYYNPKEVDRYFK